MSSFLPLKDSEKGKEIITRYLGGEANILWKELGYSNKKNLQCAMLNTYGIRISGQSGEFIPPQIEELKIINLPAVKLKTYKPTKRRKGDPETQVLLLGDHHAGEITPSYNAEVYIKRLSKVFSSTMIITELHRHMYPINDLVIVMGGDMIHGENPHQGATVETIAKGAQKQIYDLAVPELRNLILSFKQEFKTITIYTVRGNHGRYSLLAPRTSNWDMMIYRTLQSILKPYDIPVYVTDDFCQRFPIKGFRFFAFHGEQVRATQGIPYFALDRKVKSWFITYGGFNYAFCFHFHKDDFFRVSSQTKMFINGSLVTDDPYALEVIGTSAIPTQWTLGVHERRGVTWNYGLVLDEDFLPIKYEVKS